MRSWSLLAGLLIALLCGGCMAHLQGLPAPGSHTAPAGKRDPLAALSPQVLTRFISAQLILQEPATGSAADDRAARAAALLEEAISLSPRQPVLWRYLAQAWASQPAPRKALQAARKAVAMDQSDALSRYVLGLQLQRIAAYDEAEGHLRAALRYGRSGMLGSGLPVGSEYLPHYYLYEVLRQQGDHEGALSALKDWRVALPDSPDPLLLNAKLLWRIGRGAAVGNAAAEALLVEPRSKEALKILLDAELLRPLDAIASIEAALNADWSARELHLKLVGLYRRVGRYDRALDHLRSLRTLSPVGTAAFLLDEARLRLAMAQGEQTLALLEDALGTGHAVNGRFLDLLGASYKLLGRRDDGIAHLTELRAVLPEAGAHIELQIAELSAPAGPVPPAAAAGLTTIAAVHDELALLLPEWQFRGLAQSGDDYMRYLAAEQRRIYLQLQLSFMQRVAGDRQGCELVLLDLLVRHPLLNSALNALAYLWAEDSRNLDEALRLQQRALEQQPFSGAYQDTMGWIEFRRGRLDAALRYLEVANRYQPDDPEIIEHLAEVLSASGMREEAADHQRRARDLRDRAPPK